MAVYLNTYEIWDAYGGPEEGGWWYECGTPLQSILYSNDDYDDFMSNSDWDDRSEVLRKTTYSYTEGKSPKPIDNGYGGYSFQPGSDVPIDYRQDNNIATYFEDHYAESFPQVRPHYE